jgi:hypothetical protein
LKLAPAISGAFFMCPPWKGTEKGAYWGELEDMMPLPTFLTLIAVVIVAAGASLMLVQWAGVPMGLAALGAMAIALLLKVRLWH